MTILAPSRWSRLITVAWYSRRNGHSACVSWNVSASTPTTTRFGGGFCFPRIAKRASIDLRSRSAGDSKPLFSGFHDGATGKQAVALVEGLPLRLEQVVTDKVADNEDGEDLFPPHGDHPTS